MSWALVDLRGSPRPPECRSYRPSCSVIHDLTRLGEREFEALCRALAVRVLGDNVQVFGDGPDGGRELTWDGTVDHPGSSREAHWSGYGVLQAKFRRQNAGTKDLEWLHGQLR